MSNKSFSSFHESITESAFIASKEHMEEPDIQMELDSGVKLKKSLGLQHGVVMIVGGIIGSGIFVSPKGVVKEIGSVGGSLIVWFVCGLVSLIGALCYAELGSCILKSGADYAYIRKAFGDFWGFLCLWNYVIIINPIGNAVTSLTFSYYILQPFFPGCDPPQLAVLLLSILTILLLTCVNCINVNWVMRLQSLFTFLKVIALSGIILFGSFKIFKGHIENFKSPFHSTKLNPGAFALSFYSGIFSYSGWNFLNYVTEEIKNPLKNLPRSIYISIPLVTIIYLLTNVAYFSTLTPQNIIQSNAVAVTFANEAVNYLSWIMSIFVAISTFGSLSSCIFATSRLIFVGAREGQLPRGISLINIHRMTPIVALVFEAIVTISMLALGDVYQLINYVGFVESSVTMTSILGLIYMRKSQPNMIRPIKVSLILPYTFLVMIFIMLVCPLVFFPRDCLVSLLLIFTGVPMYLVGVKWTNKPKIITHYNWKLTEFLQKLTLGVFQDQKLQ